MNKAILVGRLTRDPELRNTNSGAAVVSFTVAVNRTFTSSHKGRGIPVPFPGSVAEDLFDFCKNIL